VFEKPLQQPVQLVELHSHLPFEHTWPAAQTPPSPHWQPPLVQRSPSGRQLPQVAPVRPHWVADSPASIEWQVLLPLQQPSQLAQPAHF